MCKHLLIVVIFFYSISFFTCVNAFAQQNQKGLSNYKYHSFTGKVKIKEDSKRCIIMLDAKPINHTDVQNFIAFSCRWREQEITASNTKVYIAFGTSAIAIDKARMSIEIDNHNTGTATNYSQLYFIDKKYTYYQLFLETNLDKKGSTVQDITLNFFNPDGVAHISAEGEKIKEIPTNESIAIKQSAGGEKYRNNTTVENNTTLNPQACPCPIPTYTTRLQWNCPQGQGMAPGVVTNPAITHIIVHHSAGSNTSSNWAATVLSIWNFHTGTNGWSDIGYNWLVAPDGTVFEGRGSNNINDNVQGAHFCGFNQASSGVCMMGDYTSVTVTNAARNALISLLGWRACVANIPVIGTALHVSSGIILNRISGHQDGCATSCPGTSFYSTLPTLRTDVNNYITACNVAPTPCLPSFKLLNSGCPNTTQTFTPNNVLNGGTAPVYSWFVNNILATTGNTFTPTNLTNGTKVHATMVSNATCANGVIVNSDTITVSCINVNPVPCTPSFTLLNSGCPSTTQTFTPNNVLNGGTAPVYSWFVNNVLATTGNTFTPTNLTNGTKVYATMASSATCANGVVVKSDSIVVTCIVGTNIPTVSYCTIIPNPSNGKFTLSMNLLQNTTVQYKLVDAQGKTIFTTSQEIITGTVNKTFTYPQLASGIYTLIIRSSNKQQIVKKLIVSK